MNSRVQLWCAWSGPAFLVLYAIAFWGIAQYIPPQPPSWSAAEVGQFYEVNRTAVRVGQLLALIFSTLLFPWWALISAQIARIEGRMPVLAITQFGCAVLLQVFFALCSMLWIAATFRPELDPASVRLLHDTSWLIFVMVFPGYTLQLTCIAIAGFMDQSEAPTFPRWACYFNLWVALTGAGGALAVFFKTGPFAWNGVIGFYLPVAMFAIWLLVMASLLAKAVKRQAAAPAASTPATAPGSAARARSAA